MEEHCGNLGLKGDATDVTISNPADTNIPFELNYTLSIPNFMAWSSKTPSVRVPLPQVSVPDVDDDEDDQPEPITLTGSPIESDFKTAPRSARQILRRASSSCLSQTRLRHL